MVDKLAAAVALLKHARKQHVVAKRLASVLFRTDSETACVFPSTAIPGDLNRLPGLFLRSSNSKPQKRRLPTISPRHGGMSPDCSQTYLESQGLAEPSLRDRHASERARDSLSLQGQPRNHPGVAPTSESIAPAIGAAGTLTTLPRWQARSWPAISRGQSEGWVNYAYESKPVASEKSGA